MENQVKMITSLPPSLHPVSALLTRSHDTSNGKFKFRRQDKGLLQPSR